MGGSRVTRRFPAPAAALLSACASTEPAGLAPPQTSAAETQALAAAPTVVNLEPAPVGADEPVCRKQTVTGSHRPRVVCQTVAQRRATRAAAQEWYRTGEISQIPVVPGP